MVEFWLFSSLKRWQWFVFYHFHRRTAEPLESSSTPGCDAPCSRVSPGVDYIITWESRSQGLACYAESLYWLCISYFESHSFPQSLRGWCNLERKSVCDSFFLFNSQTISARSGPGKKVIPLFSFCGFSFCGLSFSGLSFSGVGVWKSGCNEIGDLEILGTTKRKATKLTDLFGSQLAKMSFIGSVNGTRCWWQDTNNWFLRWNLRAIRSAFSKRFPAVDVIILLLKNFARYFRHGEWHVMQFVTGGFTVISQVCKGNLFSLDPNFSSSRPDLLSQGLFIPCL